MLTSSDIFVTLKAFAHQGVTNKWHLNESEILCCHHLNGTLFNKVFGWINAGRGTNSRGPIDPEQRLLKINCCIA